MAAEEITNLMRLISHMEVSKVCAIHERHFRMESADILLDEFMDRVLSFCCFWGNSPRREEGETSPTKRH